MSWLFREKKLSAFIFKTLFVAVLVAIIIMAIAITGRAIKPQPLITPAEAAYLTKRLKARSAGDCVITKTETGWQCKEFATNKIYNINYEK